jgi:hypothetical protein
VQPLLLLWVLGSCPETSPFQNVFATAKYWPFHGAGAIRFR